MPAQESASIKIDSFQRVLTELKSENLVSDYYTVLKDFDNWCFDNGHLDLVDSNSDYYSLTPVTEADSSAYRMAMMYHGNRLRRATGNIEESLKYYIEAHNHGAHVNFNDNWSWYVENSLANSYARLNQFDKAIYYYLVCAKSDAGKKQLTRLYKNLGSAYQWKGDEEKALVYYEHAINEATLKIEYRTIQSVNEQKARIFLEDNNIEDFLVSYRASKVALSHIPDGSNKNYRTSNLYTLYGEYLFSINENEKAINAYEQAIIELRKNLHGKKSREIAKVYHKIALVYLDERDYSSANLSVEKGIKFLIPDWLGSGIPSRYQVFNENTFIDLLSDKARYYYERKEGSISTTDIDSALMSIDIARTINNNLLIDIATNESKYITISDTRQLINQGVKYAYAAYKELTDKKYLDKIINYFIHSKGRLLSKSIIRNSWRKQLSNRDLEYIDSLEKLIVLELDESKVAGEDEKKFFELIQNLEQFYSNGIIEQNDESIDEPFIEYLINDEDIYVLSNIEGFDVYKIENASEELEVKVDTILNMISSRSDDIYKELSNLYSVLIPFEVNNLNSITIIPDGFLTLLPFDILMVEEDYLIKKLPISYKYQNERSSSMKSSKDRLDLFGLIPDYAQGINSIVSLERNSVLPLVYANEERRMLENLGMFDTAIESSLDVGELRFQIEISDIFHFGGHAIAEQNRSYLSLVESGEIVPLYANQLEYFPNNLKLACLSACQTGVGEVVSGEGVRSLASSFLSSGSEAVLYSLWNVNDKSTSQLMNAFYNQLGNGLGKDEALRVSKLGYIRNADPMQVHPYYWAAFCLMGETSPIVSSINWKGPLLLGAFIILGLLIFTTLAVWKTRQSGNTSF